MKEVRLRHHHLLCTRTFSGSGYDDRFVSNLKDVVSRLRSSDDLVIRLRAGCDDVCSHCPNIIGGRCKDEVSVASKDRSTALFLDLPGEAELPAGPLLELTEERLLALADIRLVCGECEWADLCNEWIRMNQDLRSRKEK